MSDREAAIQITDEEAEELYRFTIHDYISPKYYPALLKLISRIARRREETRSECH